MGDVVSTLIDRLRSLVVAAPPPAPPRFAEDDVNRDGIITYQEFEKAFKRRHGREPQKNDFWDFLAQDRDGDAAISLHEYQQRN